MTTSLRFARYQRPVLRGMGALALSGLVPGPLRGAAPIVPGEWIERRIPALPDALVDAYVDHVGADRASYGASIPPHLFPQWAFAMSGELMRGLRYPLLRAMNGGCRLEVRGPLPRGRELIVRGRLAAVDDDGRRAIITQRYTTGVEGNTNLLAAEVRVFVPLGRGRGEKTRGEKKGVLEVPAGARDLGGFAASARAGWEFALLTGDFNPVHWSRRYARASGFPGTILHGFGTFARAWEIARADRETRVLDARFTRPLSLPNEARMLADGSSVYVVDRDGIVVMQGRLG